MWNTDLVLFLRALIGDLDSAVYTDDRLEQVLVVAFYHVKNISSFAQSYTVNIAAKTISPDPVVGGDSDFCVLSAYKAACIIVGSEYKVKANNSMSMRDGPSSIDTSSGTSALGVSAKTICKEYEDLVNSYLLNGSSGGPGHAILGPYSPGADLVSWVSSSHRSNGYI